MQWPFLNRHEEQDQFEKVISGNTKNSTNFFHCKVPPASGMTAFLKYSRSKYIDRYYCFYIDGGLTIPNSLISQLLTDLFKTYPEELGEFKNYFLDKYPNDIRGKVGVFLSLVPHIGSFAKDYLKESAENADLPQLQTLAYPHLIAEMICPYLNMIAKKKPIVMFIDNAQDLDNWSLDIIKSGIDQDSQGLNYFLAFVNRKTIETTAIEDILWKIRSLGITITDMNFIPPGKKMIKEFCSFKGLEVSESGILQIAEQSSGNIYKVLTFINNNGKIQETDDELTKIQVELLGLLDIACQQLRKSDLITILVNSTHFFVEGVDRIEMDLKILLLKNYIGESELPDAETVYYLHAKANPYINKVLHSEPERLIRARNLYDYFTLAYDENTRHSKPELALLLYKLSQLVDTSATSRIGQSILSISLKMGSIESADKYIDKATLNFISHSIYDYFFEGVLLYFDKELPTGVTNVA